MHRAYFYVYNYIENQTTFLIYLKKNARRDAPNKTLISFSALLLTFSA